MSVSDHLKVSHAAVHEYIRVSDRLALVTASFFGARHDPHQMEEALSAVLKGQAHAVRGSFRWLNGADAKTAVGYVYSAAPVQVLDTEEPDVARFHKVAANVYMDNEDQSVWHMSEGQSGKFLARQNADDLIDVLESVRSGVNANTPRLRQVDRTKAAVNELASYVMVGNQSAEVDHGIVIEANDTHFIVKSMALDGEPVTIPHSQLVSASVLNPHTVPVVKGENVARLLASRSQRETASPDPHNPKLTPEEFWTLVYSYDKDYLALTLEQVRRQEAM